MKLERIIRFLPAYDKRDPDPKKNYGIHGVTMTWYLKGPLGCIQFQVYTNWNLPHVTKELGTKHDGLFLKPLPSDFGYHSPKPMYEDQKLIDRKCEFVEGGKCYYDGSSLYAQTIFALLVKEGGEAVWEKMEEEYNERFVKC